MERIDRRQLLTAGGGVALLGAILGTSTATAQNRPVPGTNGVWLQRYDVWFDPATIDLGRAPARPGQLSAGPFYLAGPIYEEGSIGADGVVKPGAARKGTHHATGWIYDAITPNAGAMHSFDLFGMGELVVIGSTETSVPIAGGTGLFRSVQGEVRSEVINAARGAYRLEFELVGQSVGK
jgi:hypothetical protein